MLHGLTELSRIATHQILKVIRSLNSELRLNDDERLDYIPTVMSVINNLPIRSRLNRTQNELFLGFRQKRRISPQYWTWKTQLEEINISPILQQLVKEFQASLVRKHEGVYDAIEYAKAIANNKKFFPILQYQVGDWVLSSIKDLPQYTDKTKKIWQGPFRVTKVLGFNCYLVTDLNGKEYKRHAHRLWFYADDLLCT